MFHFRLSSLQTSTLPLGWFQLFICFKYFNYFDGSKSRSYRKICSGKCHHPLPSLPAPILFLSALFPLTPCRLPASLISFILPVFLMHHEQMLYDSSYPLLPTWGAPYYPMLCILYVIYMYMYLCIGICIFFSAWYTIYKKI